MKKFKSIIMILIIVIAMMFVVACSNGNTPQTGGNVPDTGTETEGEENNKNIFDLSADELLAVLEESNKKLIIDGENSFYYSIDLKMFGFKLAEPLKILVEQRNIEIQLNSQSMLVLEISEDFETAVVYGLVDDEWEMKEIIFNEEFAPYLQDLNIDMADIFNILKVDSIAKLLQSSIDNFSYKSGSTYNLNEDNKEEILSNVNGIIQLGLAIIELQTEQDLSNVDLSEVLGLQNSGNTLNLYDMQVNDIYFNLDKIGEEILLTSISADVFITQGLSVTLSLSVGYDASVTIPSI